ncbi:MAG: hypothetical protein AB7F98_09325 [Novosphingobium sp.]
MAIPPRPVPPLGAPATIVVPPVGVNGKRVTTNAGLNPDQIVWNFRSALNVAALNCVQPRHAEVTSNYRTFLRTFATRLTTANRGVDTGFRARFGKGYVRQREAYLTKVYNFYALPPVRNNFCDAALIVSRESLGTTSAQLHNFAAANLPRLDQVFEEFYNSYVKYQTDLVTWNARYGQQPAPAAGAPVTH